MPTKRKPRVLGLFSGAGGIEIGFAKAGFDLVASVELVPLFCETLSANSALLGRGHAVICADISKFEPAEHGIEDIDFIIGGPPCQSFSAAGRRAGGVFGLNDLRGSLFWHYCRILRELKPKGFLFENVRGILSANSRSAWDVITSSFAEVGYDIHHRVLDAAEYGVPQHRERVLMVGTRQDTDFRFPSPTHGPASPGGSPYFSAGDALRDMDDPNEQYVSYGGKYEHELLDIPPGHNYLFFTEKMGHPSPRFAWRSRFSDFLYVAHPDSPTKTIVAQPGKWAGPFHWRKRKFTIPELKRLFSFPDEYDIQGGEIAVIRQLGNSVPPALATIVARAIKQQIFNLKEEVRLTDGNTVFDHDKRKGRKAQQTRARVIKNNVLYGHATSQQLRLFSAEEALVPVADTLLNSANESHVLEYRDTRDCVIDRSGGVDAATTFELSMVCKKGVVEIVATERTKASKGTIDLAIDFLRPVNGKLTCVRVACTLSDIKYVAVPWDCVDFAVQRFTSYDCIQKLYGHFTEPYPQFTFRIDSRRFSKSPVFQFQKELEDFSFLAEYHRLEGLAKKFGERGKKAGTAAAQELRHCGFDVRTHETNRTIKDGYYRVCYPFTISLASTTFVTWREKGQHRTADRTSIPAGAM